MIAAIGSTCGAGSGLVVSIAGATGSRPIPGRPSDPGQPGQPSDPGVPRHPVRPPVFGQARFVHQLGGEFHRDRIYQAPIHRHL